LRQGFSLWTWQSRNSLCRPGLSGMQRSTHPSAGITDAHQHSQDVFNIFFFLKRFIYCILSTLYTVAVFMHTRRGHQIPLQMVVSHHVVAGNWTQDLWKSSQCSQPLSHLSSPLNIFLKLVFGQLYGCKHPIYPNIKEVENRKQITNWA